MFKNYLKSALRDFRKHRTFSIINVLGLSIGLTAVMLIGLYVDYEKSYDSFHQDADRIHRATREFKGSDGTLSLHFSNIAPPFGPLLKEEFAGQIEALGRLMTTKASVRSERAVFIEEHFGFADPEILNVLTFQTQVGVLSEALSQPNSVALSISAALKYFGNEDPLGKSIRFNDERELMVRGVFKDLPDNSTIQLDMLTDMTMVDEFLADEGGLNSAWDNNVVQTLFKLRAGHDVSEITMGFEPFLVKHLGQNAPERQELQVQKLRDVHLKSNLSDEQGQNGDLAEVRMFTLLAMLILVIAIANYINLSTGRLLGRGKSVGIRKVLGADRAGLIKQYMTESVLLVLISTMIAAFITISLLPVLSQMVEVSIGLDIFQNWNFLVGIGVFALAIGVLAGIYPALHLSALSPVRTLKGSLGGGAKKRSMLRRSLVVFQFGISAALIVSAIVIYQQLEYLNNKSLGYNKEEMVVLRLSNDANAQYQTLKNEFLKVPGVKAAGGSSRVPSGELLDSNRGFIERDGQMTALNSEIVIKKLTVDSDFIPTYQMSLLSGRNFDIERPTDDSNFILNERSVKVIGWTVEEAIGQNMIYDNVRGTVIGVLQDFHFESLQKEISPLILMNSPDRARQLSLKVETGEMSRIMASLEAVYETFSPNDPIDYVFLDSRFEDLYASETKRSQLFMIFGSLAICLACLGLFGLALFTVSQRTKEMSIRRVLGASARQIVMVLSGEFSRLIVISILLAFPIAWLLMGDWLDSYAYRIGMDGRPFVASGLLVIFIALITISTLTIKAARSNPVNGLRED